MTYQEWVELQRKNHFSYCNINEYHEQGYKGKGLNFLNLDGGEHGEMVCKVFSDVLPETMVFSGVLSGIITNAELTHIDIIVNGKKYDFETFVKDNKIKLINCSVGGYNKIKSEFMKTYIVDKYNIILTNSAGNDSTKIISAFKGTAIIVGALKYNNGNPIVESYSGIGSELDFVTFNHLYSGTSFSSPFLLGQIGILIQYFGDFNQSQAIEILKICSVDLGEPGKDNQYGYGIPVLPIDVEKIAAIKNIINGGGVVVDFKDVEDTRWSKEAIDFCVDKGLFEGYEDGTFRPESSVTREQMAVILQRIINLSV